MNVVAVYQWLVLAGLGLVLLTLLVNFCCFERLQAVEEQAGRAGDRPLVSILVPARNEARNIGACVSSLLAQTYPNWELIVIDDHSEDDTAAIVGRLGLTNAEGAGPRRLLISGTPLPEGWTGKSWACHQLAAKARGEFLFFTDADTEHAPGLVSALVACSQRTRASLVSAWPRLITGSLGEQVVVTILPVLALSSYPHWLLCLLQNSRLGALIPRRVLRFLGAANGQCMFFQRAAYERIGGHEAVRSHLVEDVGLGRAITARLGEGMRLFNCEAVTLSTCRMYRSFGEVWEGFSKNLWPAFEGSWAAFVVFGCVQASLFFLPFLQLFDGGCYRSLIWLQVALILGIRALVAVRFRTSWWGVVLHPFGYILGFAIGLNSLRLILTRGVTWKGRRYQG